MDALPAELVDLILDHGDHSSLKCLRGVSKRYHNAATSRVFEHFYMALLDDSLEKLCHLSKSPLAKHITRFTFYCDILPDQEIWRRRDWEQRIDHRPDYRIWARERDISPRVSLEGRQYDGRSFKDYETLPRHSFTEQQLDRAWEEFIRLGLQQRGWREDVHSLIFKEHFAMLPNLVECTAVTATPFKGKTSNWPVWKRLRLRMLVSPDDWMYKTTHWKDGHRGTMAGQAALCLLEAVGFRACFVGTKHIDKLTVHASQSGPWRRLMGRTAGTQTIYHNTRYHTVLDGFRHLTELDLRISHVAENDQDNSEATGIEIVELLHSATQLKRLSLAYSDVGPAFAFTTLSSEPTLAPLFKGKSPWTQLEHLALNLDAPHSLLLPFFRSLSTTLVSLELRDMFVEDPDELINQIPKVLKLRHIYIECIWRGFSLRSATEEIRCVFQQGSDVDEQYERAVKAYLLREATECPDFMYDEERHTEQREF
ncbi:hypothetical protein LTR37_006694 [Vermiconidia calcicola]|uniref:Uncharacterized protein n=1 Tax=Vermiconidia calcicola TaxID=1690605 RepID=A0ACC3NFA2_9PEZI|nr:hypothetical protein LTR37_006694 [Vermiconidia calcicola]